MPPLFIPHLILGVCRSYLLLPFMGALEGKKTPSAPCQEQTGTIIFKPG